MEKFVRLNIDRPSKAVVKRYEIYDVSTVYEAQRKQGLMAHDLRPLIDNTLVCGPAVTATCYAGDNLMIHAAVEACQPGDILVVTTIGSPSNCGMVGELIVRALMKRGVKGLVIDAGIRDAARIRELGFPVWSRAICSEGTTKVRGGWVNAETICGDVTVGPGDLVMADEDGVVVIRKEDIEETEKLTLNRLEKEDKTKEKIENGQLSIDFYNLRGVLEKENVRYVDD
ncbi:4-carboxy-4-hydroxy-2-oxoadipate aldolase/oxaloacetate decarboxylase [Alicyclobacillus sp. SO9]|uniref:4-carboxy-4-hydroxy-2-oxoadipate aldolase/oxaloacetate decarboxylase n=1 Tax=Alicyclobacillus sp. SO9 TaxID=2665646 RepID=UPI0018E841FF|nr:4-carboxy-4-hydroxy-2-oxoadipate aldolase/oxaloacetate decarboxylase [Alicyclobacillus sp. SO9]QQE77612.1 4-carboxy-4-hydroxy-2-oxoadipate aldolase/oxaloacetate decarboxylase [Alicyclobacillus sp. SO9]